MTAMFPHDFMTLHAAKMVEYLIAVVYLLLFIPFWRYVNAKPERAEIVVPASEPATAREWFSVPDGLFFHPGHAWLRVEGPDTVAVGIDDFAGKLVGAPSAIALPSVGQNLVQGEPAWALVADGRSIEMLSPVDGTVVEVNQAAAAYPVVAHHRPYTDGWLVKVRTAKLAGNLKQLFSGRLARRWIDDLADSLRVDLAPALGPVAQDGGVIVDGIARVVAADRWDEVARRYLLTETGAGGATRASGLPGGRHA